MAHLDPAGVYGPAPGHPTPEEAAAQLLQAQRTLRAAAVDVRVHALATLAVGLMLGLIGAWTTAMFDSHLWFVGAGLLVAATGGVSFWEFRAGRVITRSSRRLRSYGMGLSGGLVVLISTSGLGTPIVVALVAAPCAVAALLTLVLGRR